MVSGGIKPEPKWLIDTHGMLEALTTKSNSVKSAIIAAIESGEMLILKPVSAELKAAYPHVWDDFKAIQNRKYHPIGVADIKAASALTEGYGSSLLGSIPSKEHFQAVAAARLRGLTLVSYRKALKHYEAIARKCSLPADTCSAVADFA